MTFFTGTAIGGHKQLLVDVTAHMVAEGWTVLKTETIADEDHVYLQGPNIPFGLSNTNVYINIATSTDSANGVYNWALRGAVGFNTNLPIDQQPGTSPLGPAITLFQNDIPYWIAINDRRIVMAAKVSTVFASLYMGFILPYGAPSDIPFPMYVAGNSRSITIPFTNSTFSLGGFWDPSSGAGYFRRLDGVWRSVVNYSTSGSRTGEALSERYVTWPYKYNEIDSHGQAPNGSYPLLPVKLIREERGDTSLGDLFGELDDVFYINGVNNAPENTTIVNGETYFITQSSYRNTRRDFVAIKQV